MAALLTEELDPCEALISHGMVADGLASMDVLRTSRAWPDDEWEAATQRLVDRGLVALGPDGGGGFTPAGQEQRDRIETLTDQLSVEAWSALGEDEAARLRGIVRPWSKALLAGVFGPPPSPR